MSRTGFLLGIDVGTTALKAVLIDLEGRLVAQAQQEYPTYHPMESAAEQDPEDWWRAACGTIRAVLQQSRIDPSAVRGVGVSSQAPTMLPVDTEGHPLTRAHI